MNQNKNSNKTYFIGYLVVAVANCLIAIANLIGGKMYLGMIFLCVGIGWLCKAFVDMKKPTKKNDE